MVSNNQKIGEKCLFTFYKLRNFSKKPLETSLVFLPNLGPAVTHQDPKITCFATKCWRDKWLTKISSRPSSEGIPIKFILEQLT